MHRNTPVNSISDGPITTLLPTLCILVDALSRPHAKRGKSVNDLKSGTPIGHSAKTAGGRLQLNTHTPYVCGFARRHMVHGCMVYTERAQMAAVSCGTSLASAVSTPLRWIFKNAL